MQVDDETPLDANLKGSKTNILVAESHHLKQTLDHEFINKQEDDILFYTE